MFRPFRTRPRVKAFLLALLVGFFGIISILMSASPQIARAADSNTINFQARLLTSGGAVVPDGTYNLDFKIYNADSTTGSVGTCSGACLWEETRKVFNSQGVTVINGYFSVTLGSVTSFASTINWDQQLYLTMNIGGTSAGSSPTWDGEMQSSGHSIKMTALPYAFRAGKLASSISSNEQVLQFAGSFAQATTITLPDPGASTATICYQSAAACGFAPSTGGTGYVNLQGSTPGSAQTGHFNISGTGIAGTFLASTFDTATGVSLNLGTSTATAISIGKSGITTTVNGALTVAQNLTANGDSLFKTTTDSTTAFRIQNSAGSNLLQGDTANFQLSVANLNSNGAITVASGANGFVSLRSSLSSGQLTVSGNEITDVTRATNTQGDGRNPPDSSTAIWEATTNLTKNGGAETDTTSNVTTAGSGTTTISRATGIAKFGSASFKVVTDGGGANQGVVWQDSAGANSHIPVSSSTTYTGSAWVKGSTGSEALRISITWYDNTGASISTTSTNFTPTTSFARYTISGASPSNATQAVVWVNTNGTSAVTFWADGGQLEQKSVATPYVETNGSTGPRTAARVQATSSTLNTTAGWFAIRFRTGWASTDDPFAGTAIPVFSWRTDSTHLLELRYQTSSDQFVFVRQNNDGAASATSAAQSFSAGSTITLIANWTSSNLYLSVNGEALSGHSSSNSSGPSLPSTFDIAGYGTGLSMKIDGDVLWTAAGAGSLSDTDGTNIYKYGNSDPTLANLSTTATSSNPTFVWQANRSDYSGTDVAAVAKSTLTLDDVNIYRASAGGLTIQGGVNSATAFQIQNASGSAVFNVNTSNGLVSQTTFGTTYLGGADASGSTSTGTVNTSSFNSVFTAGRYIYAATSASGATCSQTAGSADGCELQVYDITNPSSPTYIGGADASGSTNSGSANSSFNTVFVAGHYAFIGKAGDATACSQTAGSAVGCELQVYDISNPSSPTYVGGASSGGNTNSGTASSDFDSIYVAGRYLYVGKSSPASGPCSQTAGSADNCEFQVYDISNPAVPLFITSMDAGGSATGSAAGAFQTVYIAGRYAYIGKAGNAGSCAGAGSAVGCEFQIYDITNPGSPTFVSGLDSSGSNSPGNTNSGTNSIVVSGRYAYVAKKGNVGTCASGAGNATGCALAVYDISNPSSPTYVGGADSNGVTNGGTSAVDYNSLFVAGRYVYVAQAGSNTGCSQTAGSALGCELKIFDISNPAAPTYVGGADASGTTNSGTATTDFKSLFLTGRYIAVGRGTPTGGPNCSTADGCELQIWDTSGIEATSVTAHSLTAGTLLVQDNAVVNGQLSVGGSLVVGRHAEIQGNLSVTGSVLLRNQTDSTTAFQIQNSAGTSLFTADTTNLKISVTNLQASGVLSVANNGASAQLRASLVTNNVTVSGNEITDATRTADVQGDGRNAPDSSYGVWGAATNYLPNTGGENSGSITGWNQNGSATVTQDNSRAKFGSGSYKIVTGTTNGSGILPFSGSFRPTTTAGDVWAASAWVWAPSGAAERLIVDGINGSGGATADPAVATAFTGTSSWQRVTANFTVSDATTATVRVRVVSNSTTNTTFWVDGLQIEKNNYGYATPYIENNSTTAGSTAARSSARVRANTSYLDSTTGWVTARVRMGFASTAAASGLAKVFDWNCSTDSTNCLSGYYDFSDQKWKMVNKTTTPSTATNTASSSADSFSAGDVRTVIFKWDSSNVYVSFNGSSFVSASRTGVPSMGDTTFDIAGRNGNDMFNGDVLWIATGNTATGAGTLTDPDANTLYHLGNSDPNIPDIAAIDGASSPAFVWKADTTRYQDTNPAYRATLTLDDVNLYRDAGGALSIQPANGIVNINASALNNELRIFDSAGNYTSLKATTNAGLSLQTATGVNTLLLDTGSSSGTVSIGTTAGAVNIGANTTIASGKTLTVSTIRPNADSTTAFQLQNSSGSATILNIDTTNNRLGINTTNPQDALSVVGDVGIATGRFNTAFGGFGQYSNLLHYSEQLDVSTSGNWIQGSSTTVTPNTTAAPDGQISAETINYAATTNNWIHQTYDTGSALGTSRTFTFSFWAKAAGGDITAARTVIRDSPNTESSGNLNFTLSSNWERYTFTKTFTTSTNTTIDVYIQNNSVTGTFRVWGAQLEEASTAGVYVPTTTDRIASVSRGLVVGANSALFKNSTDSTTAFQIQNAAGSSNLFIADTLNSRIGIGAQPANALLTIGTNTTTNSGGIFFGTDTNLYRSAADTLKTDDSLVIGSALSIGGSSTFSGNLIAAGSATGTTATTSGTGTTTTTLTFTGTTSFANNDVIFIDNAGQDYYTRIISGGSAASVTVSPAVTFENARTVTKYNVQNIGSDVNGAPASNNSRFFQGYFLGGVVTGAGSTTLSDGLLSSANNLLFQVGTGGSIQFQDASGSSLLALGSASSGNTSIGNASGALTLTGSSSSTIVLNGVTVDATELNRLDGKDAALIDTNDAVSTAIIGTGALNAGSITSGFGAIDVGTDNISTTGTVFGNNFDRTTSGALAIGNTNASSVSICNSAACNVVQIGTNNDADTITIGDSSDTVGINGTTTITGGSSGTALTVNTGAASSIGAIIKGAASQTADLFQLQDSTAANLFRIDASGNQEISTGYLNTAFGGFGKYSNLLVQSEDFFTTWTTSGTTTGSAANDAGSNPAPDGNTTADKLVSASNGASFDQTTATAPTNNNYTFSVWLKTNSGTQNVDLRIDGATSGTGTAKTVAVHTTWERFFVTQNTNGFTGNIKVRLFPGGTGGQGTVVAWGAQLIQASNPGAYIRTTTSTVAGSDGLVSGPLSIDTTGSINTPGSVTGVGINAGSGLLQGTGGLTLTGAILVNNNGSSTIGLNTGSSSGQITIGGGSSPLVIDSTAFDVSTAGALSGISSISLSGAISGGTTYSGSGNISTTAGDFQSATNHGLDTSSGSGTLLIGNTNASTISIGNNAASHTINVGASSTGGTITIGNTSGTDLVLQDAQWNVTGAGAATFVGVNSGTGLLQGTGGLTLTGTTQINNSGSSNTSIGALATGGTITIGNTSGTDLVLQDANWGITGAGNITTTGTYNTNTFTSTALTFSGASPVISASTTNTGLTLQGNGNGTLLLNTTGAGTVNLGTANTTIIGIGSSSSAVSVDCSTGTCSFGATNTGHTTTIGSTNASATTTIQGGNGITIQAGGTSTLALNTGGAGTVNLGTTNTTTIGIGSSSSTTTILGATNINNSGSATTVIGNASAAINLNGDTTVASGRVLKVSTIRPNADSATAIQVQNNGGTSTLLDFDTTNGRIGINTTTPIEALTVVNGDVGIAAGRFNTAFGGFGQYSNLLHYSEQLDQSGAGNWPQSNVTLTANDATAPDGQTSAEKLNYTATSSNFIHQTYDTGASLSSPSNRTFTFSFWAKAVAASGDITAGRAVVRDSPNTETTGSLNFTISSNWERYSFTKTFSTSTNTTVDVYIQSNATLGSIHVWGAQLEEASTAGVYVPTTTDRIASVSRGLVVGANSALFKNSTDSTTAFQVQNSAGSSIFSIDSSDQRVGIGTSSTPSQLLSVGGTTGNFTVSSAGAVVAVGVNSGSGLLQGTGGLTLTGTAQINNTGSASTSIGATATGGTITVGNTSGTDLVLQDANWNVTGGGAATFSGGVTVSGGALAVNTASGITSNQATLIINAGGNVDVQDALNADNITTDTGGISIAASQSYTGAGAVTLSSAAATALTITGNASSTWSTAGTGSNLIIRSGAATANTAIIIDTNAVSGGSGGVTVTTGNASAGVSGANNINTGSGTTATGNIVLLSGNASGGTAGNITLDVGTSSSGNGSILIGDAARAQTIDIGRTATGGTITIGASSGTDLVLQDANWGVTGPGAATFVGVNAGSGLLQGTGGLTLTGTTQINNSGSSNTSIGALATGGTITIGNTSGTDLILQDANWNVTGGGAATFASLTSNGATTVNTSNANAFKVQNGTTSVFNIDTTNSTGNNLVANPSFESATSNWTALGSGSPTQTATQAYEGSNSLKITTTTAANDGAKYTTGSSFLANGTTYTMNFYAKTDSTLTMNSFEFGHADDGTTPTFVACYSTGQTLNSGWQKFTCTWTSGTITGNPFIYFRKTSSASDSNYTLYIDDITLQTDANATSNYRNATLNLTGTVINGSVVMQNSVNSSTAFQIQNASGSQIFNVDTTDTNLISNPGFEVNTTGWSAQGTNTTIRRDTTQTYLGLASLKVTQVTSTSANSGAQFSLNPIVTSASTTYTVSFYGKLDAGSAAFSDLQIRYSPDGAATSDCSVTALNSTTMVSGGWTRFYCAVSSATAPTTSGFIRIMSTGTTIHTYYIDGVQMEASTVANMTNYGAGQFSLNGVITSPVTIKSISDSTTAFQVQNAGGINFIGFDSLNKTLSLGVTGSTATASTVNIASTSGNATQIVTIGSTGNTSNTVNIEAGTGATAIQIGNGNTAHGIQIGANSGSSANNAILIGQNGNSSSTLTLDAGTAATAIQIGNSNTNHGIQIGANASGVQTISIGNAVASSALTLTAGSGNMALNTTSGTITLQSTTSGAINLKPGGTSNIVIGTADTTGTLLVLDTKNNTGSGTTTEDPTEVDGGMYYNSATHTFRCGRDGIFSDCALDEIDHNYDFEDDFMGGATAAGTGIGNLNWTNVNGATVCGTNAYNPTTAGLVGHDHPGVFQLVTSASAGSTCMIRMPTNNTVTLAADDVVKATVAVSATSNERTQIGIANWATTPVTTQEPNAANSSGVWWEAVSGTANWEYCYASNGAATCATAGSVAVAANTFVKLEIRVIDTTAGASKVDFIINGTKTSLTGKTIDWGTTNRLTPGFYCNNNGTANAITCSIDYFQWRGVITTSGGR